MPTYPVGDASYLDAAVRRALEGKAEEVRQEARRNAPWRRPSWSRCPCSACRPGSGPAVLPGSSDEIVMQALDVIGDYLDVMVADRVPAPPLVCDCGHPDSGHDDTPGVGCTHRPYCLCVHPTGQRVPVPRLALAPASQADPALIVRGVR